ncbi:MAG: PH domain-containing protein [Pseudomonadota bacterium]
MSEQAIAGRWHPSQWCNAGYFVSGTIAVVMGVFLGISQAASDLVGKAGWGIALIGFFLLIWKYLEIRCVAYTLTDEQMTLQSGVLNRTTDNLELYRVKDWRVSQPIHLRTLGLGNVELMTSDQTSPEFLMVAVSDPSSIAKRIRENVEQVRTTKGVRELDVTPG